MLKFKSKRDFVLFSCITSSLAVLLSIISILTDQWIVADGRFVSMADVVSPINYGLFNGILDRRLTNNMNTEYEIVVTCLYNENICALICGSSKSIRKKVLEDLYHNKQVVFDTSCPSIDPDLYSIAETVNYRDNLMNATMYLFTVVTLCLSMFFGIVSAVLAIWNTVSEPQLRIFGKSSLFVYNIVASCFVITATIFWGVEYAVDLSDNVALHYTITGEMTSDGTLGFSFWLNIPSTVLYLASIFLLFISNPETRTANINSENPQKHRVNMKSEIAEDVDV